MNETLFQEFVRLANCLSPENLCCDGELPPAQVKLRLKRIKAEWKELEKEAGREVSQDEIETAWYARVLNGGRGR